MLRKSPFVFAAVAMAMGAGPVAMADSAAMATYDDFDARWIDPDKWNGDSIRGGMETVWRIADDGFLETGMRGFSDITTDEGVARNRNSLYVNEDSAAGVTAIGADAFVNWGYVRGCEGSAESDSEARFRISGFFFNSGGSESCGDRTGDIYVQMYLRDRDDDGEASDTYAVVASVWRCDDAGCDTGTSMFYERLGTVAEDEMLHMNVSWDDANNMFHFESGVGSVTYDYSEQMKNVGDVAGYTYSKGIQTTTNVANCITEADSRPYGVIDARVDNFYVNKDYMSLASDVESRSCESSGNGGGESSIADRFVVGDWYQGYYAYRGEDGNHYILRRQKWYVWNGEKYTRAEAAGQAQFADKILSRRTGKVPAEQKAIRKANREKLKEARKQARAQARAERKAAREAARNNGNS